MVRSGKERATANDDDATQLSGNEAQRIAGRNADHVAAGKASGAKRKANAMSEEESKRRKAAHMREVRAGKAAEKAASAAAAGIEARAAAAMVPSLEEFNRWVAEDGEAVDEDEWDAFQRFSHIEYLEPEDCEQMAFVELFLDWRNSDDYKSYMRELEALGMHESDQDEWEPPPPIYPRSGSLPKCVECRRNPCACPDDRGDPDDNPWAFEYFGHLTPPPGSPDDWTPSFTWDEFLDREYARTAGELGWWNTNWGDAARPREKSTWEQHEEERRVRKERERAAGRPPYRDQPRYGPRGVPAGDELFREERAAWYEAFTGRSIAAASLQEQNDLCDAIERRFRAYTDGRSGAAGCSTETGE